MPSAMFYEIYSTLVKVRKGQRSGTCYRYNQAPHLPQHTNGKVTTSQFEITNERQEFSSFPAGDHKASLNRRARKHNKNKIEITYLIHKGSTALEQSVKYYTGELKPVSRRANLTVSSDVDQDTYMVGLNERPLNYKCTIS